MGIDYSFVYGLRLTEEDIFELFPKQVLNFIQRKAALENMPPVNSLPTVAQLWGTLNMGISMYEYLDCIDFTLQDDMIQSCIDYDTICKPADRLDGRSLIIVGIVIKKCAGSCQVTSNIPVVSKEATGKWEDFVRTNSELLHREPEFFVYASGDKYYF